MVLVVACFPPKKINSTFPSLFFFSSPLLLPLVRILKAAHDLPKGTPTPALRLSLSRLAAEGGGSPHRPCPPLPLPMM